MVRIFLSVVLLASLLRTQVSGQSRLIDSLEKIASLHSKDTVGARAIGDIGVEFARKDLTQAMKYQRRSFLLSHSLGFLAGESMAYTQLAIYSSKLGQTDSAHFFLDGLKAFSEAHATTNNVANYNFTAGLIFKNEGRFTDALPYQLRALAGFEKMKSQIAVAGQLLNIGNIYTELGDYKKAVSFHLRALSLFEELKNKRGESFTNQSIGNDFVKLGRPKEGLPYLQKSLAQKEELKDKRSIASAWSGLANLYKSMHEYDKAMDYNIKAVQASQELKLTSEEAVANFEIGAIFSLQKKDNDAISYFKKSKALARQMGDSALCKAVDAALVGMKSSADNKINSESNLMASLKSSIVSGRKQTELSTYQQLVDFYTIHKDYEKAFLFQKKLLEARDSVQGVQLNLQIKQLEEQFKVEKKEKEIALLMKDRQLSAVELKRQKTIQYAILTLAAMIGVIAWLAINRYLVVQRSNRLVEIERVRNTIARDLHDDIGSTLSSINIISRMAIKTDSNEPLVQQFRKIEEYSGKMMETMSDIVWSINPGNDTADKTVSRMKEFAAEILEPRNIRYAFREAGDLADMPMSVQQRRNLFLIFKESVNNAAKYSKCSSVIVELSCSQKLFSFAVYDDGLGFDMATVRRGNGLANMEARASMMGSRLTVDSSPGKGTRIAIATLIT